MTGERLRIWRARALAGCFAAGLSLAPLPVLADVAPGVMAAVESTLSSDGKLRDFYRERNYEPLWLNGASVRPEADQFIRLLRTSRLDGLDPGDYDPDDLAALVDEARGGSPEALADAERALSRTLGDYARSLGRRRSSADIVYVDKSLRPTRPSLRDTLEAAEAARSLGDYLEAVRNPIYGRLRAGLTDYAERWGRLPAIHIPAGSPIRAGDRARVRLLRERLGLSLEGGLDRGVTQAVRDFQSAHGLKADGVAGADTIAALNRDPRHYMELIRINLDRARALPVDLGERFVHVDAAAARLWMYENGRIVDTMKVIVGKPVEQTPMMAALLRYQIHNPYWNIPPDLVARRVATRALENGAESLRGHYEVLSGWEAGARILDPAAIDWQAVADGRITVRVRQMPGPANAMGDMKFMMPNAHGIYLHDTPERALFDLDNRRQSSGCVRVEDARRLSRWLFDGKVPRANGKPEQRVDFPEPVPVYITYLTAVPDGEGIAFRGDPYGRDARLLAQR